MTTNFLASLFIFVGTGCYTFYYAGPDFTDDRAVKGFVFAALFANALFYYYVAAYIEMDEQMRHIFQTKSRFEWGLRAINQILLYSLWFLLERGWEYFKYAFMAQYITYIWWDFVAFGVLPHGFATVFLDFAGFLLTIVFLATGDYILANKGNIGTGAFFFWRVLTVMYFVLVIVGGIMYKFKPWDKKYWRRPELH